MTHYEWIIETFEILAKDDTSKSVLFVACGEVCCEINGCPFWCETKEEFRQLVEFFHDETFIE